MKHPKRTSDISGCFSPDPEKMSKQQFTKWFFYPDVSRNLHEKAGFFIVRMRTRIKK